MVTSEPVPDVMVIVGKTPLELPVHSANTICVLVTVPGLQLVELGVDPSYWHEFEATCPGVDA